MDLPPFHDLLHAVLHPLMALIPPEVHAIIHTALHGGAGGMGM
jgi:hypothetical protein